MEKIENKPYFTTSEVAQLLKVSRITVFNYVKKGLIKANKVGKTYLISREEVLRLVERNDLTKERRSEIGREVDFIVKKYGEALKKLGEE
ncbi:MAG: helix-turn-helix domain-containing protein [Candidatus Vogelbacteria bacterium]|nr:helix-turn-helix domain-containing protein [Candidatus Vogelbacteria bacterium]